MECPTAVRHLHGDTGARLAREQLEFVAAKVAVVAGGHGRRYLAESEESDAVHIGCYWRRVVL